MQSGNGTDDKPGRTDEMNDTHSKTSKPKTSGGGQHHPREKSVGDALRAVYDEAIDEKVPDSMLDLLSKLG